MKLNLEERWQKHPLFRVFLALSLCIVRSTSKAAWIDTTSTFPYTKHLEARPSMSKIIISYAHSKVATQSNQESNLDVEFFSRNSTSKQTVSYL